MHPFSLLVSLGGATAYNLKLNGRKGARFGLVFVLPMMALAAIANPVFNHEGATILGYLPTGNPLTLESIYYGLAAAVMIAAVITWFSCYTAVMSSDKFVYLFGRVIPALSLVLSMTLRFVPRFKKQFGVVKEAQQCVGRSITDGPLLQRMKNAVKIFSIMVTWALENAIETADSMKGRGYGLPGRTAFSIYRFDARDRAMLIWLSCCGLYILAGWASGQFQWRYYPTVRGASGALSFTFQCIYLALCLTPTIIDMAEDRKWKQLRSEI